MWPVVLEQQGGSSKAANAAFRGIAAALAEREGRDPDKVRAERTRRLAVVIARAKAMRIQRRLAKAAQKKPPWLAAVRSAFSLKAEEDR